MKKHIIIACPSLMTFASCSEGTMDYINKDTSNPPVEIVPAKFSLTDAIVGTSFATVSGPYAFYASTFTEQEFGTGNNQFRNAELRIKSEVAAATTYNNEWNQTYSTVANLRNIIKKTSEGGLNYTQVDILGMAQTLFALNFGVLTDLHGDVPCSEAGWGAEILNPKIDTQESIYNEAILGMLDAAIANLEAAGTVNNAGDQDVLFKGEPADWIAFAYALKSRYLLHTQFRNPAVLPLVIEAANKAIEAGFDGAELKVFNGTSAINPWYGFYRSRQYTGSSATVIDLMAARNDNRLAIYNFDFWEENIYGTPGNAEQAGYTQVLNIPTFIYKANNSIHLMSKSELYFILAEAKTRLGQDARAEFDAAIVASFADYEVSDAYPRDTKFVNNAAEYAASLPLSLEEVMVQKYLAQCRDEQIEAYTDIRRCKALGEEFIKLQNPLNTQAGSNYWPERFPYGNSSVVSNPAMEEAFVNIDIYEDKIWLFGGDR